ncbi:hypothetical protein GCM10025875_19660 [Litorihabitans aurantiacus]|uniref:Amidohydrolase-related domain-containing protein n=1 Tax=Litorihabitans aurantiacus TaxID=1930061 RepID=A0AA38CSZ1_9MICO|nr:amidohydrolase family protein [Litorihabitans aurantiacus]GMA31974.1 hypothetical protein GCM10025875_19660 [Litorihabitans aurantiacus]
MIDTHLHAWERSRSTYAWMEPESPLARDVPGDEAVAASRAAGFDTQVLVQSDDTVGDTEHLLEVAARHPSVLGVVAWVPLARADRARELLDRWSEGDGVVVGVRSLVHVDPDPALLEAPGTAETLGVLAARGLPLDVPDAWPHHVDQVQRIAGTDGLTVVLDHLGKPPRTRRTGTRGRGRCTRSPPRRAPSPRCRGSTTPGARSPAMRSPSCGTRRSRRSDRTV